MSDSSFRLDYSGRRALLASRLTEPAPGRIQLLAGPRQTTLPFELADTFGAHAVYAAAVREATFDIVP